MIRLINNIFNKDYVSWEIWHGLNECRFRVYSMIRIFSKMISSNCDEFCNHLSNHFINILLPLSKCLLFESDVVDGLSIIFSCFNDSIAKHSKVISLAVVKQYIKEKKAFKMLKSEKKSANKSIGSSLKLIEHVIKLLHKNMNAPSIKTVPRNV